MAEEATRGKVKEGLKEWAEVEVCKKDGGREEAIRKRGEAAVRADIEKLVDETEPLIERIVQQALKELKKGIEERLYRPEVIDPNPSGRIRQSTGPLFKLEPRELPLHATIHWSVFERLADESSRYAPRSLFYLNRRILEGRYAIETALKQLYRGKRETHEKETEEALAKQGPQESPAKAGEGHTAKAAGAQDPEDRRSLEKLQEWLMTHSTDTLTKDQFDKAGEWARSLRMGKWPGDAAKRLEPPTELDNRFPSKAPGAAAPSTRNKPAS